MKIANYNIHPENYNKPTPALLKRIADVLLITIIAVDPLMAQLPDFEGKQWVTWGWNTFVVVFKLVSKLITEEK